MMWLLALGLPSFAEENLPELWTQMHEGQLVHLVEGEPQEAIGIFQALLKDLPAEHPIFCDLLFSLSRAQYDVGNIESAKKSIREVINIDEDPKEALHYYSLLLAEENILQDLPVTRDMSFYRHENILFDLFAVRFEGAAQQSSIIDIVLDVNEAVDIKIQLYDSSGKMKKQSFSFAKGRQDIRIQRDQIPISEQGKDLFLIEIITAQKGSIQPLFVSSR